MVAAARACVEAMAKRWQVDAALVKSKVDVDAAVAWRWNQAQGLPGAVDCGRIQRARADPRRPGFLPVGVSKQRGKLGQALSPFHLTVPEQLLRFATSDGTPEGDPLPHRPLELVWQAAKVMKKEIADSGLANDAYFQRRAAIYSRGDVRRRYIAREDIGGALLSWRTQPPVGYVASRKYYCMAYAAAVSATAAFGFLESLRATGVNLLLLGPDGHPLFEGDGAREAATREAVATEIVFGDAYADTRLQFGHERVLAALLLGQRPWTKHADPTGGLLPKEGTAK